MSIYNWTILALKYDIVYHSKYTYYYWPKKCKGTNLRDIHIKVAVNRSALLHIKVAVYKYHTNEFVYKSEGVGAIADWEGKLMMS
jgi:hypothetical protein